MFLWRLHEQVLYYEVIYSKGEIFGARFIAVSRRRRQGTGQRHFSVRASQSEFDSEAWLIASL